MPHVRLELLQPDGLGEFAALLGLPDFGGCFCAVWTAFGDDWAARCADPARPNLAHTAAEVRRGRQAGFLVREDQRVVGWVGAGPRSAFPAASIRLGSRLSEVEGAWMIGCLALPAAERGRGLADAVVAAVIDRATAAGAPCIEAFPTRPWDEPRSYRGSERLFARHGFVGIADEPDQESRILLMRRSLA